MTKRRSIKAIVAMCAVAAIAGCFISCRQTPQKPLVGVSASRSEADGDCLSTNYSRAILRSGGVPVVIPTVGTPEEAAAIIDKLDAVVFSGGEDLNPAWYGEAILNETVEIDHVRDRSDSLLAMAALASGKPVLGICRGEQLLNILLGGSLYQDIPSQLPGVHSHRGTRHKVAVGAGTFLSRAIGADSVEVNSFHHQAVKSLAPGLSVVAVSDDGIVEAYENAQVWAVQFHPEVLLREDSRWLPLFEAFIARAR